MMSFLFILQSAARTASCTLSVPDALPISLLSQAGPSHETHTNHFVVSDRWGNVVSYTNTIEQLGGSGIVVPGRGFLLNNELTDFNFAPTQGTAPDPNLPAAGKRPRSSMSPTTVLRHGQPFPAVGSPGWQRRRSGVPEPLTRRVCRWRRCVGLVRGQHTDVRRRHADVRRDTAT